MRLMAVNPADSDQSVSMKAYLPLEVEPEDIIYKVIWKLVMILNRKLLRLWRIPAETQRGFRKEIEIKDVWVIDSAAIATIRQRPKISWRVLKTNFIERYRAL